MVANPGHHPQGDFVLRNGQLTEGMEHRLTFSGIGFYHPELFSGINTDAFPLAPLLRKAMQQHQVSGEIHHGAWIDVGTPERLKKLEQMLSG